MTYTTALSFSWALTWRLALAHFVLLLILLMLLLAFGSPHRGASVPLIGLGDAVLGWLLAWPFVIKRVLAPQQMFSNASLSSRFRVRYWAAVILGLVSDLATLVPVVMAVLMARLLGFRIPNPVALLIFSCIRLFVTLPLGVRRFFRRLPEIA
jgi:hypothetical protein